MAHQFISQNNKKQKIYLHGDTYYYQDVHVSVLKHYL